MSVQVDTALIGAGLLQMEVRWMARAHVCICKGVQVGVCASGCWQQHKTNTAACWLQEVCLEPVEVTSRLYALKDKVNRYWEFLQQTMQPCSRGTRLTQRGNGKWLASPGRVPLIGCG